MINFSLSDPLLPSIELKSVKRPLNKEKWEEKENIFPHSFCRPPKNLPKIKKFKSTTSRQIFPYDSNETASTEKTSNVFTKAEVMGHGFERLQIAYAKALAVWKTAEPVKEQLLVWVEAARGQGGSASVPGHHATHPDMTSGLCDNLRELYIELIKKEGVNEGTKTILISKGFSEEELDQLNASKNPVLINTIFDKCWRGKTSIIEEVKHFAYTNSFPYIINLRVDKALENNERESAAFLYNQCMKGEITPEALVIELARIICTFFHQRILRIEKQIEDKENHKGRINEKNLKNLSEYFQWELLGTEIPSFKLLAGVLNPETHQLRLMSENEKLIIRNRLLRLAV